jgi:aconitate hydratase
LLLGVKAVIAESFERIHRSNLVGMGVLPLQFADGQGRESLGLTGQESFSITGIPAAVDSAGKTRAKVTATLNGSSKTFEAIVRIDTPQEAEYYRSGGILPYVLRQLAGRQAAV